MLRSPVVLEISPNVAEVMVCEIGLSKIGVLERLNASPRISNHWPSRTGNLFERERLKIVAPGPRTTPGPAHSLLVLPTACQISFPCRREARSSTRLRSCAWRRLIAAPIPSGGHRGSACRPIERRTVRCHRNSRSNLTWRATRCRRSDIRSPC